MTHWRKWPLLALACLTLAACGPRKPAIPATVASGDGRCQVTLPIGWMQARNLNDVAAIQAADKNNEVYLIVVRDFKSDLGRPFTIHEHAQLTLDRFLTAVADPRIAGPVEMQINGRRAIRHEMTGILKSENLKLTYLRTTVETDRAFYMVLAWTTADRFTRNRAVLEQATAGFAELP